MFIVYRDGDFVFKRDIIAKSGEKMQNTIKILLLFPVSIIFGAVGGHRLPYDSGENLDELGRIFAQIDLRGRQAFDLLGRPYHSGSDDVSDFYDPSKCDRGFRKQQVDAESGGRFDQKGKHPRFSSAATALIDRMMRSQCEDIQDFARMQEEKGWCDFSDPQYVQRQREWADRKEGVRRAPMHLPKTKECQDLKEASKGKTFPACRGSIKEVYDDLRSLKSDVQNYQYVPEVAHFLQKYEQIDYMTMDQTQAWSLHLRETISAYEKRFDTSLAILQREFRYYGGITQVRRRLRIHELDQWEYLKTLKDINDEFLWLEQALEQVQPSNPKVSSFVPNRGCECSPVAEPPHHQVPSSAERDGIFVAVQSLKESMIAKRHIPEVAQLLEQYEKEQWVNFVSVEDVQKQCQWLWDAVAQYRVAQADSGCNQGWQEDFRVYQPPVHAPYFNKDIFDCTQEDLKEFSEDFQKNMEFFRKSRDSARSQQGQVLNYSDLINRRALRNCLALFQSVAMFNDPDLSGFCNKWQECNGEPSDKEVLAMQTSFYDLYVVSAGIKSMEDYSAYLEPK